MTSERDHDLVEQVRSGSSGVLQADDPEAVAAAVGQDPGVVLVAAAALTRAVAGARVRVAKLVVERARAADVEGSPTVRAAEAHLRRQQAAWKVAWWERDEAAPDLDDWSLRLPAGGPITLVTVDAGAGVDDAAHAEMTAAAPAAVRVVVLQPRAS